MPDADTKFELKKYSDPYVSLREVVFQDDGLLVYRDPDVGVGDDTPSGVSVEAEKRWWEPSPVASAADVIEEFVEQILVKLGLLDT